MLDRFAQAIGQVLPPTARNIDYWLITGGRRPDIGAGTAVLKRFHVESIVVVDPDAWTVSLRGLVQQAQAAGIRVTGSAGRSPSMESPCPSPAIVVAG